MDFSNESLSFVERTKKHLADNPHDTKDILKAALDSMDQWEQSVRQSRSPIYQNALNEVLIFVDKKKLIKGGVSFMINSAFVLFPYGNKGGGKAMSDFFDTFKKAFNDENGNESKVNKKIRDWLSSTGRQEYIVWLEEFIIERGI